MRTALKSLQIAAGHQRIPLEAAHGREGEVRERRGDGPGHRRLVVSTAVRKRSAAGE